MNKQYKIIFVRRQPKDIMWSYHLTDKATFMKRFNTLSEAAKYIYNTVFLEFRGPSGVNYVNPCKKVVIWRLLNFSPEDTRILNRKIDAMYKKNLRCAHDHI